MKESITLRRVKYLKDQLYTRFLEKGSRRISKYSLEDLILTKIGGEQRTIKKYLQLLRRFHVIQMSQRPGEWILCSDTDYRVKTPMQQVLVIGEEEPP